MPLSVMKETDNVMKRFGRENRECYVWWGGYYTDGYGQVVTAIWPEVQTDFGRIHLTNRQLASLMANSGHWIKFCLSNSIHIHRELTAKMRWMLLIPQQLIQDLSQLLCRISLCQTFGICATPTSTSTFRTINGGSCCDTKSKKSSCLSHRGLGWRCDRCHRKNEQFSF